MSVDTLGSILGAAVAAKGADLVLHSTVPLLSDGGTYSPCAELLNQHQ